VLDIGGPVQAFDEARQMGADYVIRHCATTPTVESAQGVTYADLEPLPEVKADDVVIVPGYPVMRIGPPRWLSAWLKQAFRVGAQVCSVCTGSFVLGDAGLLDGRRCTTHWKRLEEMQKRFPRAKVMSDRLFVQDGRLITSAGIASGIDMALDLIEQHHGPRMAARVAREMVVYLRRDGHQRQESVYLDHRTHLHPGIHAVQDWFIANPSRPARLTELSSVAHMSPRNLTRVFRQATGISIHEYRTRLRLEQVRTLLNNPELTLEGIAERCGFAGARQLRRVWKAAFGSAPASARRKASSVVGLRSSASRNLKKSKSA
jgi:transcriptional regulator GlxA family with amidase domain